MLLQLLQDAQTEKTSRLKLKASQRPRNDDDLYEWIRDVLGFKMARYATHEEHKSPFQFIADAFFEREQTLLARGNRGGGKTRAYSIFEVATTLFKDGIFVVHVGGSEGQARDGYAYYAGSKAKDGEDGLMRSALFSDMLADDPLVSKTILTNGSKLEIRTGGSERAVSGPHPQVLVIDELDHIDTNTLATAMEMPMSKGGHSATTLMASSQYHSNGTMQSLINTARDRGIATYQFDIFDTMESCGQEYPTDCGACPFHYWTNPYTGNFEELCKGRGAKAGGHYPFRDALGKFKNAVDPESWALQNLLLSDKEQGLVFPQYDEGSRLPFPPQGADLNNWTCCAGIDQRGRGRIVVMAQAPYTASNGNKIRWAIAEWADDSSTPSKLIEAARNIKQKVLDDFGLHITTFWAEKASEDLIKDWPEDLNCRTINKEVASVAYGLGRLRDAFRDFSQDRSLFVDPKRCPGLDNALMHRFKCKKLPDGTFDRDTPGKDGEDFASALRYAFVGGPTRHYSNVPQIIIVPRSDTVRELKRRGFSVGDTKWRAY